MYGWLAAPLVLVAGSSPAGQAPANAVSSRTVIDPPFFGLAVVSADVPSSSPPHAATTSPAAATDVATSHLTRCARNRMVLLLFGDLIPSDSAPGTNVQNV